MRPVVCGHRGGRGPGWPPENTLAAFARAIAEGATALELDARLTADGGVVVLHDPTLARVTGGADAREVGEVTRAELARLSLEGHAIPSLDDALELAGRRAVVNVEIKADRPRKGALTLAVLRAVARARGDVVVSSFHPGVCALARAVAPQVEVALLTAQGIHPSPHAVWPRLPKILAAIHVEDVEATEAHLAAIARAGMRPVVWTVNDGPRARLLARWGARWIITDRPAEIGRALDAS